MALQSRRWWPPLDSTLRQVCELYFKVKPMFVEPGIKTGIPVLTDQSCRARRRPHRQLCCGIRTLGRAHVSSLIWALRLPSMRSRKKGSFLAAQSLPALASPQTRCFSRAARLPRVDIKKPAKVIGTGTVDNIQIGLYYGYIGLVDGILERMIAELGSGTRTVATGGLAKLIAGGSKHINGVDEMLTLTGLRLIYERNLDRHRKRGA